MDETVGTELSAMTSEGMSAWDGVEATLNDFDPAQTWSPWDDSGRITFGDPEGDASLWQQQSTDFTCAVVAQRGILEAFGKPVSEAQLVYDATVNGWLSDGGTSVSDVGALLEYHGIPTHARHGATIEDLAAELAEGHKVIVGLDSGELWGTDHPLEDLLHGESADHAVQVTGVSVDTDGKAWVTLNDSGMSDGQGKTYPAEQFINAWNDSGNHYMATDHAPGALAAGDETVYGATNKDSQHIAAAASVFIADPGLTTGAALVGVVGHAWWNNPHWADGLPAAIQELDSAARDQIAQWI